MVAAKKIPTEEVTDARDLLKQAADRPVMVEFNGQRFRIVHETEHDIVHPTSNNKHREDIWKDYDPEKALAALRSLQGIYDGIDTEELKREIRESRGQFSAGRPYDFPEVFPLGRTKPHPKDDPFADYDPEKALAAMRSIAGMLKGIDINALKAELRAERGHGVSQDEQTNGDE